MNNEARTHFRAIYGDQAQWIELSAIEGDPDDRQHCRFRQGWFYYTPERLDALLQQVDQLAARYGNVYTSVTGYSQQARDKAYALPGRLIFIDDCQPGSYTYTLQTSPDREQACIILDDLADVPTREQIARRFSRSADKSGWDITQLMRVPGTLNTKRRAGGKYHPKWVAETGHVVTLIPRTMRAYSLAELDKQAPKIAQEAQPAGESADLNWPEVEQWLGRASALMDEQSIPRRFKPHQQSYRVLTGEVIPCNGQGLADESTKRAFLARGLCWARYPDDTAAAILWKHTSAEYIARKGTEWHKDDIARIIAKERLIVAAQVADYQIRPITAAELSHCKQAGLPQPIETTPARSRARKDRPQQVSGAGGYLAWLHTQLDPQSGSVMLSQKQCAARLGCCVRTIKRYEKALGNQIERRIFAQRQAGCLFILPSDVVTTLPSDVVIADLDIAQQSAENTEPTPHGETHPPEAPSPPAASPAWCSRDELAEWVTEAFDSYPGRASFRKVQKHVEMLADGRRVNAATLHRLYTKELTRRRYARQDAAEAKKARAMRFDVLQRTSRALGTQVAGIRKALREGVQLPDKLEYQIEYADGSTRTFKTKKPAVLTEKYAQMLQHRAGIYAAEEARRAESEAEHIRRVGYSLTEQAEMLDLVDQVRTDRPRIGRAVTALPGGVCSPQPSGPQAGALATDTGSVIARLQAAKAQREQARI